MRTSALVGVHCLGNVHFWLTGANAVHATPNSRAEFAALIWNMVDTSAERSRVYTGLLVGLHNLVPFSRTLRRLVIRFIERAGYKGFEGAGVEIEKLIELLDHLHVTAEE